MVWDDKTKSCYSHTYFLEYGKWGNSLTEEEAIKLGLIKVSPSKAILNKEKKTHKKITKEK